MLNRIGRAFLVSGVVAPWLGALLWLAMPVAGTADEHVSFEKIGAEFLGEIRPILSESCMKCHSTDEQKGTLDLEQFATIDDVRRSTKTWLKVAEMLDNGEMPPKDAPQPAAERRTRLRSWVAGYLKTESLASAGDPGPVVLRRLNNAEYTYTLLDLIGIDLQPAREFPADGAAGEGFTNTGNALVMSPALLSKYLDAGKKVASHAVLLPDGIRFAPGATRRDWTNELLAQIRGFYARFTASGGGTQVNLQGIVFGTNDGGLLPVERYLRATIRNRDALAAGLKSFEDVAREDGLNGKYLRTLWATMNGSEPLPVLDRFRDRWRTARVEDAPALAEEIYRWQKALWRFTSVGHIGKLGGPKAWMEPVSPVVDGQQLRLKLPELASGEVTLYLVARDAGDGSEHDVVVWDKPRLVRPGRPDLLLRDVRAVSRELVELRRQAFAASARCLDAAAIASAAKGGVDLDALAKKHDVEPRILAAWLDYLGIGTSEAAVRIDTPLKARIENSAGYDFIKGWGSPDLPIAVANSSNALVRIPGNMPPHSVAVHPTPALKVAAGWLSPASAVLQIAGRVQHAHPECGNGVTWSLELRRGAVRQKLAAGVSQGATVVPVGPVKDVAVQPGDLVSLVIDARDGNHACDLTTVDLTLSGGGQTWNLAREVSPDILAGNPHSDALGNSGVWHFYSEPEKGGSSDAIIPAGSLLAKWQSSGNDQDKHRLARAIEELLTTGQPAAKGSPDRLLHDQLNSLRGPLVSSFRVTGTGGASAAAAAGATAPAEAIGLDPRLFGTQPGGPAIDPASIAVRAASTLEIRLPADLAAGCELVAEGALERSHADLGSVQLQLLASPPGQNSAASPDLPVVAGAGSNARRRFEAAFDTIRQIFPPALCYSKIVPVDEVITLTLFYREDDLLRRLMLDRAQAAELDRLWAELRYVSQDALTLVDAFTQLLEYASQDADPKVFEPMRQPIADRARALRGQLVASEPRHLDAVIALAGRAYRRPLSSAETSELGGLYKTLRGEGIAHDEAIRLVIARVLVSAAFLYRLEKAAPGTKAAPVDGWELASRLSYFLWSSMPDDELRALAAAGTLGRTEVLAAQARRMCKDTRIRRLATEFACQWLHIYDFESLDEKSERHFPTFTKLRSAMHEEVVCGFTDLFRNGGSVLSAFDCDYTFLNEDLAKHYEIPGVAGKEWRRVDGVRKYGRGGILALAATLAKQSGASRTSPILRGNWVSEVLLGERLPRPPKNVPVLPDDEAATRGLTVRQLVEKHTSDSRCASCHVRIDPLGYALEAYDAIGRRRQRDLGDRPIDTRSHLRDGTEFDGLDGLRQYLVTTRRDAVVRQFCRKFLGYALGRGSSFPIFRYSRRWNRRYRSTITGSRPCSSQLSPAASSARFAARPQTAHESCRWRRRITKSNKRPESVQIMRNTMNKQSFSRRTFLRGAGVTMALPWMESLRVWGDEAGAVRSASEAPVRLAVLFAGNGFHSREWWARGSGRNMELGQVLAPLADFREKMVFVRGLYNAEALKGNIHSSQTGNLLSGAPLASGGEIRSGTSFDQLLARTHARSTKVPSLVLACEKSNPSVHKNYSMLYSSHISWTSPTTPTPLELYPALAFDRLFRDEAERGDKSVLDAVLLDARDFRRAVSSSDQRKLDEYLDSVREVEQRIERAGQRGELQGFRPTLDQPNIPRPADGIPQDIGEHMRLMCDILVLGFQTDTTRICTLKLNNDHSSLRFPNLGVDYMIHHLLSHSDTADWLKVNQFFLKQIAYIARKLDAIHEGSRSALDNSMIVFCSSMLNGNHDATQLPVVVLGQAGGRLKGGRVLDYLGKPNRKMCSLYLSLLDKAGLHLDEFGDSREKLADV